jgi:membrane-associated phospholipid phosphatase
MSKQKKTKSYIFARIISDIFVPPTFVLFSFIYIGLTVEKTSSDTLWVIIIGVLFGFLLPIIIFLILRKHNFVANRDATIKEERTLPYLIGIFLAMIAALVLYYIGTSAIAVALWLAYIGNSALLILINKFWKISAHAIGSSTPVGLLFFLHGNSALWLFIIVGIIALSRLKLKVHTPAQVAAGAIYGFALTYLQLSFFVGFLK